MSNPNLGIIASESAKGTSYSAKKRGFVQGATQRELEQIHQDIAQIQGDIADLKEYQVENRYEASFIS